MKRTSTLIIFILAVGLNVNGQELYSKNGVTITASPNISLKKDSYLGSVKSITNDGYVAYYKVEDVWTEVAYHKNFERVNGLPNVISYNPKKEIDFNHSFDFSGRHFVLKGTVDREQKTNQFTQVELSEDGDPISKPIELASVEGDEYYSNPRNANLSHQVSSDGTKLLVKLKLPEQRVGDGRKYTIYKYFVYDIDMNLMWSRTFEFKHEGGIFVYDQSYFEDDGSVLVWGKLDRGRKAPEGVKPYAIRFYKILENEFDRVDVDLDQRLHYWRFRYANNKVYLFSLLKRGRGDDVEGFRVVSWSSEDSQGELSLIPFGKEHLIKNQSEKEIKRITKLADKQKPMLLPKFDFYDIIATTDGGFILTGQERNDKVLSGEITYTTEYHGLDFHLIAINADCKMVWSQIIPLKQVTFWEDYGCIVKPVGEKVYCFFNDAAENLVPGWTPSEGVNRYKRKNDPVGMIIIDSKNPDARQKRMKVLDNSRLNGHLVPEQFKTTDGLNVGAMRVQTGKEKARMLWFDFEE